MWYSRWSYFPEASTGLSVLINYTDSKWLWQEGIYWKACVTDDGSTAQWQKGQGIRCEETRETLPHPAPSPHNHSRWLALCKDPFFFLPAEGVIPTMGCHSLTSPSFLSLSFSVFSRGLASYQAIQCWNSSRLYPMSSYFSSDRDLIHAHRDLIQSLSLLRGFPYLLSKTDLPPSIKTLYPLT